MPVMDGLEATAAIRAAERPTGRHVPIVAMTAHAMKGDREQCLRAGMDGYVAKPIRSEELLAVLEKFGPRPAAAPADAPRSAGPSPAARDRAAAARPARSSVAAAGGAGLAEGFDPAAALRHVGGDRELLAELAAAFRDESRSLLAELHEALEEHDAARLRGAAHTLKGAAGVFGANSVAETAKQLEMTGRAGDLAPAADLLASLKRSSSGSTTP